MDLVSTQPKGEIFPKAQAAERMTCSSFAGLCNVLSLSRGVDADIVDPGDLYCA
jgi:hypothetical protein